jgi:hypothetical protein
MATLALVVGIWLIVIGVMEVVAAFGIRASTKKVATKPAADVVPDVTSEAKEATEAKESTN